MRRLRMTRTLGIGLIALAGMFALAACSSGISQEEADAKDRQIRELQSQVSQMQEQRAELEQDSKFWAQLTSLMQPVDMPTMTDHRAFMLSESGTVIALHFDNMDLEQADNLNWVALGVPGVFCKADQERVEAQFGSGFIHFHDMVNDVHGGAPGAQGVWFVHTAVRDLQAPWGAVNQGIDHQFMPTPAPNC